MLKELFEKYKTTKAFAKSVKEKLFRWQIDEPLNINNGIDEMMPWKKIHLENIEDDGFTNNQSQKTLTNETYSSFSKRAKKSHFIDLIGEKLEMLTNSKNSCIFFLKK